VRGMKMKGYLIIKNERTGEKRKASGVFTRNFAYLLLRVINNAGVEHEQYTVKDITNVDRTIAVRTFIRTTLSQFVYANAYDVVSNRQDITYINTGLLAYVTTSDYTPTPDDFTLPTRDLTIHLTNKAIIMNPNNTQIVFTGSAITSTALAIKGVGIGNAVYPLKVDESYPGMPIVVLIDGFAITPLDFSAGDTVSITYRIALA
jgi:hypothetical protein